MKPFDQTYFFTALAPWINRIIPNVRTRPFFCRILLAILATKTIGALLTLGHQVLTNPVDGTWQYYLYLTLEMIQYGCLFWNVWYGFKQIFIWIIPLDPKGTLTADSIGLAISLGTLLFLTGKVSSLSDQTYALPLHLVLIGGFIVSVGLPTVWKKTTA